MDRTLVRWSADQFCSIASRMCRRAPEVSAVVLFASLLALPLCAQVGGPRYLDPSLNSEERAADLVGRMTLEEKAGQMVNAAPAIPRLSVPAYDWWNEALHGVARSGYATLFPQAIGMAATWDESLLGDIGKVVSTEARAKYNDAVLNNVHSIYFGLTLWAPNINIFRDPRWGRGQETYGEDPFLTGTLGSAYVRGLQGDDPRYLRTIATPKHFAVHSGPESTRHSADVNPTRFDLWDTYLPAFRQTIVEAKAASIMCSYNGVDHAPACASTQLLNDILRKDWGFTGFVTSDCGAVDGFFLAKGLHVVADAAQAAALGIHAGTDTNCGYTYLKLPNAVGRGLVTEAEIDISLKRLFAARFKLGLFDPNDLNPYASIPMSVVSSVDHRRLALRAARKSIVLLQNRVDFLPYENKHGTIAVVGPNAASLSAIEGNYNTIPRNPTLPVDAIAKEFAGSKILYRQGANYAEGATLPAPRTIFHPRRGDPVNGLTAEYFNGTSFSAKPVVTRVDPQIDFDWSAGAPADNVDLHSFSVRWSGTISVPEAARYQFNVRLENCYPCFEDIGYTVSLDGRVVAQFHSPATMRHREPATPTFSLNFIDTAPHDLRVEYTHQSELFGAGMTLEWMPPAKPLLDEAVAAANSADVVFAFIGLTPELEGEEMPLNVPGFHGGDREDIGLPATQQKLLEALVKTGKPVVAVLMNGSALAVPWVDAHATAVLEAWYPGEEGGRAIAQTIDGANNPGGRLPVTFYNSVDDLPPFADYSMHSRTYRYFTGKPLYGFGYGLSYTRFQYTGPKASTLRVKAGGKILIDVDLQNVGQRDGEEVAELYLAGPRSLLSPKYALKGASRLSLRAGESRHLQFELDARAMSSVDEDGSRSVMPGVYRVWVLGGQPTPSSLSTHFAVSGRMKVVK